MRQNRSSPRQVRPKFDSEDVICEKSNYSLEQKDRLEEHLKPAA